MTDKQPRATVIAHFNDDGSTLVEHLLDGEVVDLAVIEAREDRDIFDELGKRGDLDSE